MSALTAIAVIVGALPPGAGVERLALLGHLFCRASLVGMLDVLVEDVCRELAVDDIELRVVMVAAQWGGALGIERRVGDHQFLVGVASPVVPEDGASVSIESAAGGIAPASRTEEVDTRTAQEQVGMIVHASVACP